ncbi:MAG: hypothetical protein Crog4KO_13120 [Crocinitomicaceae bacterium]
MKTLLFILATLATTTIYAQGELDDSGPEVIALNYKPIYRSVDFVQTDSVRNTELGQNEAIYHFDFLNLLPEDSNAIVHFSVDSTDSWQLLKKGNLHVKTTPGIHSFQIYVNENYWEATSVGLPILGQTELTFDVILRRRMINEPVMTFKPVIYLYPSEETEVIVDVNIKKGQHPFFYPDYHENWKCKAKPNGDLTIDGEQYRYLFWEAQQNDHLQEIEVDQGFVVKGSEAVSFLEDKLSNFGLSAAEQADFITFWGPKIAQNEQNLIHFEWNETCEKFADLNISPQPDYIYRVYMFVAPLDAQMDIQPQIIPQMNRSGFTVLEWGGQISKYQPNKTL